MPGLLLAVSLVGALFTLNALRPVRNQYLMALSFFPAWLTSELAIVHVGWQAVATALFVRAGALDAWPGWAGLAVTVVSWSFLLSMVRDTARTGAAVRHALAEALGPESRALAEMPVVAGDKSRLRRLLLPFDLRDRRVQVIRGVTFGRAGGRDLRLDILRPRQPHEAAPVLVHVHGGAWILGFKERQGLPLMNQLAARGWICVNVDYRLSPFATYPDHVVDVKRAIAWVKDHIAEYGGDPGFVVLTGGSAGGHLTAVAALTAGRAELQPGFEDADTSVEAAMPFYGIYDFTNRLGTMPARWVRDFLAPVVMKATPDDDPERYRLASPLDLVHEDAPPFLVVHGELDNLAPVADAREFVARLRAVSENPVVYVEVPRGHHAFDVFHCGRSGAAVDAVVRFLGHVHQAHRDRTAVAGRVAGGEGGGSGEVPPKTSDGQAAAG